MRSPSRARRPLRARVAVPLLAALALAACSSEPAEDATPAASATDGTDGDAETAAPNLDLPDAPSDDVAATVGEAEVAVADVTARAALQGVGPDDPALREVERQVLTQFVQVAAVEQAAAAELGVDIDAVSDGPALEAAVAERIEAQGGPEAFAAAAEAQGITVEDAEQLAAADAEIQLLVQAVQDALVANLADDAVDEDALRAAYEDDPAQYQSSDVAHILLETEQEALDALDRLEAGEDFAELAAELSTGPSGPNGGALGLAPRGSYVQPFQDAVYADDTVIGEVVGPVETEFGFHLILVNDILVEPFEDVVEQARLAAIDADFQSFVDGALSDASVEVDPYYGSWDAASSSVVVG